MRLCVLASNHSVHSLTKASSSRTKKLVALIIAMSDNNNYMRHMMMGIKSKSQMPMKRD